MKSLPYTQEDEIFAVYTNTDLTEGRGQEYPFAFTPSPSAAKRLSDSKGVMGSDGDIKKVKTFYSPEHSCWFAPIGRVVSATTDDLKQDRLLKKQEATAVLIKKFENGEEITPEERKELLSMLNPKK